ncbi:MAG: hypothetical protein KDH96_02415 [Candidatus Riesia sp.]|nr:hypothetical protein [Candidatus Riesia sp.]
MEFILINEGKTPLMQQMVPQDVINTLFDSIQLDMLYNNKKFKVIHKQLSDNNTISVHLNFIDTELQNQINNDTQSYKLCFSVKAEKQENIEKPLVLIDDIYFLSNSIQL